MIHFHYLIHLTIRMTRNMKEVNAKLPKARYGEKEMMEGADSNQEKKILKELIIRLKRR